MPVADDNRSPIDTPSVARSERSIVTTPTTADAAANRKHTLPLGDPAAEREQTHDGGGERQREPHVQQELAGDAAHGRRWRRRHGDARRDDRARRHVDPEAERARGRVPVRLGDHAPAHRVDAVGQARGERDPQLVAVPGHGLDRSRLHRCGVHVQDVHDRQRRVGRLGERHGDRRRVPDRGARSPPDRNAGGSRARAAGPARPRAITQAMPSASDGRPIRLMLHPRS